MGADLKDERIILRWFLKMSVLIRLLWSIMSADLFHMSIRVL
jgi:hypothetical protein